jgi:predicted RND superfamily exporter protein
MAFLTKLFTRWPWVTIAVILGISAFFGYEMRYVRINNDVKEFLPETQPERQQYFRSLQIFGGEFAAVIGVSVEDGGPHQDIFNPAALQRVQELTDWLEKLEIEALYEYSVWATPEEAARIIAARSESKPCTAEQIKEIEEKPIPENLQNYLRVWVCKAPKKIALDRVVSLATMKVIHDEVVPPSTPGGEPEHKLAIDPPWPSVPQTQAEADKARAGMNTWALYQNNVISPPDPKTGHVKSTAIYAFYPDGVAIEYSTKLQQTIEQRVAEMDKPDDGLRFQTGGVPFISVWLGKYLLSDLKRLIPFVMAVILVVLILSFRNFGGVALPFATVVLGTLWTVGLTALLRKPLTLITSAIPTLITAVGSAYTIHLYHHYLEHRRTGWSPRGAVEDSMVKVGMAIVMAGLTTVGGFLSLATSSVIPVRDFGYLASFGTFASLLITLSFAPAVLTLGRNKDMKAATVEETDPARGPLGRSLAWLAKLLIERPKLIAVLTVVCLAVGGLLASRVEVTSNIAHYFRAASEIRRADNYLVSQFGGVNTFYITIDGGKNDFWKEPAQLAKLDTLQTHLDQTFPELIGKTMSVNDYLKKMWMTLRYDDPKEYRIPDTQQGVADCLFLFSQKSDALTSVIDFDYRRVRLLVKLRHGDTKYMGQVKTEIDRWIAANWPEMKGRPLPPPPLWHSIMINLALFNPVPKEINERFNYSGEAYIRYVVDRFIVVGQMRSILFSLVVVFILAMIIFRSIVGGGLSVLPTIMAVIGNFAMMGLLGIPLDVGTSLVSGAAVGTGIDYAIHYINGFRLCRMAGEHTADAVRTSHLVTGKAIVYNALAVALGFFVLTMSNFNPVIRMGLLTGICTFFASGIAITVLPVLLVWLRPKFIRKVARNGE